MGNQDDEILTVDEVAAFLKAGKRTVYRLAANGTLPAFKLGGTWRFRRADLNAWMESKTVSAVAQPVNKLVAILPTGTGKSVCYQIPALSKFDKPAP